MRRSPALLFLVLALATSGATGCRIEPVEDSVRRAGTGEEAAASDTAASRASLLQRVRSDLVRSAAAWNRGDLEGFMAPYREAPTTTYVGGSGLRVGHEAIRQRYAPLFEEGARRDSLRFEDLRVRRLTDEVAVGTARWVLYRRGDEVTGTGPFTLVLRRVDGSWKIVHDHSSSYERETSGSEEGEG